ncbi:MAG: TerB family tellurite resistance protein [Albidovulum sp.]|nr:TerB family tellurite resistance protein [Albidovulum sp.]
MKFPWPGPSEGSRGSVDDETTENSLETYRSALNRLELKSPVEHPDLFKLELEIGDRAYSRLLDRKRLLEIWDVVGAGGSGAAFMSSSFVATTFFSEIGVLAWIGLGAAVTPLGWVLAGAIASGTMWYFVRKWFLKDDHKVRKSPKNINTPLDMLAVSLLDLMVPLMLRVAKADGEICDREREVIFEVLQFNWGFNPLFVEAALKCIEDTLENYPEIDDLAANLAKFARSCPDIDERKFCDHLVQRLERIARSDFMEDPEETAAVLRVRRCIDKQLSRGSIDLIREWLGAIRSILNRTGIKISNKDWLGAAISFFAGMEIKMPKPDLKNLSSALRRNTDTAE